MGWERVSKKMYSDKLQCVRKRIIYRNSDFPGVQIASIKHAKTYADGTAVWHRTEYRVEEPRTGDYWTFFRLIDAKLFVGRVLEMKAKI